MKRKPLDMNDKFYALPKKKQDRIINAGFRVFSRNSYKKSPVREIAFEADISKSLLFFYFKNKKELYLFLWQKAREITTETVRRSGLPEDADLFDMMYQSMANKMELLKLYPDIMDFSVNVYYEDDPEVRDDIRKTVKPYTELTTNRTLAATDPSIYKDGLDLEKMYKFIYLASEGYMWQMSRSGNIDAGKVMEDFREMTGFWKELFLK